MEKVNLIYLAAGSGSRLKNKTQKYPKCMIKINGKRLISYNYKFFDYFHRVYIVTGYKSKNLKKKLLDRKFNFCNNKKYKSTNMVYSAFIPNITSGDVVICYGDIIFDHRIGNNLLKKKYNFIPVKKKWIYLWKKRMSEKEIKNDAENLIIKNNIVKKIGEKIQNSFPKYQFMGLIKLKNKTYNKLKIFFNKESMKNVDFTNFLNLSIKKRLLVLRTYPTDLFWYEIDTLKDFKIAEDNLKDLYKI